MTDAWEDSATMNGKGTGCNSMKWNHVVRERYQSPVLESTETKLRKGTPRNVRVPEQLVPKQLVQLVSKECLPWSQIPETAKTFCSSKGFGFLTFSRPLISQHAPQKHFYESIFFLIFGMSLIATGGQTQKHTALSLYHVVWY